MQRNWWHQKNVKIDFTIENYLTIGSFFALLCVTEKLYFSHTIQNLIYFNSICDVWWMQHNSLLLLLLFFFCKKYKSLYHSQIEIVKVIVMDMEANLNSLLQWRNISVGRTVFCMHWICDFMVYVQYDESNLNRYTSNDNVRLCFVIYSLVKNLAENNEIFDLKKRKDEFILKHCILVMPLPLYYYFILTNGPTKWSCEK